MTKSRGILPPRQVWTAAHLEQLCTRYPHEKTDAIAADLGRALNRVYQKAAALGLKKSAEYLASPDACRLRRGGNVGLVFRFQPGQAVWNKGKHYTTGGRSAEWRFKPGQIPANLLPVGHIRVNSEGYQDIKTAPGPRNWVPLHRWNWKLAHGEYPARGMALVFKDENRMNCDIGNLELISRSDLMKRNSLHNLPKELAELVQLRGAVNRQINKRLKNEQ